MSLSRKGDGLYASNTFVDIQGGFEKFVQSRIGGTTCAYRGYFKLTASLEGTHSSFQLYRILTL